MKKLLAVGLGVLTAIGGFVDIGDFVANAEAGARFGMSLAWVVLVGVIGICIYAEMSARVAVITRRATFDLIRERLGPRAAMANLVASLFVNFLTLTAEIAGVALALELATSVNYLLWLPVTAFLVWIVIWRVRFGTMENVVGLAGLGLVVFGVAVWQLDPPWHQLASSATNLGPPPGETVAAYLYFAVSLFGAALTPYEVFFFSSGAVEEKWTLSDLVTARANVFVGFPLGGALSVCIMAATALYFHPMDVAVSHVSQVALPVVVALGKLGLAFLLIGFFAATFGAALETGLSSGYALSQFYGWQWGKFQPPRKAARFHSVIILFMVAATGLALTAVDPVKVTEYSLVFSAVALPLTYFPILVIANDRRYMGERANGRLLNAAATVYLLLILTVALAAIPVMIWSRGGA